MGSATVFHPSVALGAGAGVLVVDVVGLGLEGDDRGGADGEAGEGELVGCKDWPRVQDVEGPEGDGDGDGARAGAGLGFLPLSFGSLRSAAQREGGGGGRGGGEDVGPADVPPSCVLETSSGGGGAGTGEGDGDEGKGVGLEGDGFVAQRSGILTSAGAGTGTACFLWPKGGNTSLEPVGGAGMETGTGTGGLGTEEEVA